MTNVILKNFEVRKVGEEYRASVRYQYEDEKGLWEMVADNVVLPVCRSGFIITNRVDPYPYTNRVDPYPYDEYVQIDFGLGPCDIVSSEKDLGIRATLISEKIHEMTVEEIEEKLGYRVRIIVKGEDKND